eukprot:797552-Pleurochrysis_carterae.AAC.1
MNHAPLPTPIASHSLGRALARQDAAAAAEMKRETLVVRSLKLRRCASMPDLASTGTALLEKEDKEKLQTESNDDYSSKGTRAPSIARSHCY